MGQIKITLSGSFGNGSKTVSAEQYGHQQAIADAIAYLVSEMGPAIQNDHKCHTGGHFPASAFGRLTVPVV